MEQEKRSERTHRLDRRHQDNAHRAELLVKEEEARRLNVKNLLLRDEITGLKDQINQKGDKLNQLSGQIEDMRIQLEEAAAKSQQQEKQLRASSRSEANLKNELLSLSGVTSDSAKLLSEKLALSRELAQLQPEVEHLRSQLGNQKTILSEKLALERQLNALEVELANEKRAVQRAAQKQESDGSAAEEDLRHQIEDLEKKLAAEKRAAQRAKKDQENKESEAEQELRQQVQQLEKQLAKERQTIEKLKQAKPRESTGESEEAMEELRLKLAGSEKTQAQLKQRLADTKLELREAKEELKTVRAELVAAQEAPVMMAKKEAAKPATKKPIQRKRRANEMETAEPALMTPSNADVRHKRPLKKGTFGHTLMGEKSTFSITPFLNKTVNLSDVTAEVPTAEALAAEADDLNSTEDAGVDAPAGTDAVSEAEVVTETVTTTTKVPVKEVKARGRPPKAKVLGEAAPSKRNLKVATGRKAATKSEPTLGKVMEEEDDVSLEKENRSAETTVSITKNLSLVSGNTIGKLSVEAAEPKKKKRKLLGGAREPKTIFDGEPEEDDNDAKPLPAVTATKRVKALGPAKMLTKGPLGAARNAFGKTSFSPLKRDRRGVNASFLA